jgi:hypothetical protein
VCHCDRQPVKYQIAFLGTGIKFCSKECLLENYEKTAALGVRLGYATVIDNIGILSCDKEKGKRRAA